jgi:hypothetical protein
MDPASELREQHICLGRKLDLDFRGAFTGHHISRMKVGLGIVENSSFLK